MEQLLFSIAIVVIGGIVIAFKASMQKDSARYWSRVAREFGLRLVNGGLMGGLEMSGAVDGIGVTIQTEMRGGSNSRQTVTVVRARPNRQMPADLQIGPEGYGGGIMKMLGAQDIPLESRRHDEALMVKGRETRAVQGLLDRPEARPALDLLKDEGDRLVFDEGLFVHELSGDGGKRLADTIRGVVRAARALDRAAAGPWEDAARELGLRYEEPDLTAYLEGTLSGLEVRVHTQLTPSRTRFRVHLKGGLPHGVRLRAGKGVIQLGDPILDGRLIIEPVDLVDDAPASADPIDWLKARLQDPEHDLRGCLMDVLQGLEGAAVEDGDVILQHDGRAGPELVDVIRRLTALGVALSDGGETSGGGR